MRRKIGIKEIEDMALGATVLGAGGGGDPYVGKLMAIEAIKKYGEVELISPDEVPDDAVVCVSQMMGAPTIMVEKICSGLEPMATYDELVKELGQEAVAITDHGNVQSFPHGFKAAKKAGIQLIYGMEANIVEDKVPITYNEVDLDLNEATYVVFDVETTGLSAIYNDLIQVAASKMYKGNVIEEFDEFIDPGHPLSDRKSVV